MRTEDTKPQIAGALIGRRWANKLNAAFSDHGVRFLHRDAAIGDLSIVYLPQKQWRNVLAVRVEHHVAGYSLEAGQSSECIADAPLVQPGATYGVQKDSHLIVCQRGEVVRLFVIAGLVLRVEFEPARVPACRIVRENGFEAFGSGPG